MSKKQELKSLPKRSSVQRRLHKRRTRLETMANTSLWCQICGTWENLQLDHVIAKTKIPCNRKIPLEHNRMVLCASCNAMKSDMYPSEVIKHLDRMGAQTAKVRFIEGLHRRWQRKT